MSVPILTPAQSLEARENLRLQQPAVVSGLKSENPGITFTKTYLSEFESGARNLPPKTLRALRDFFESQGHEFSDELEVDDAPQAGDQVRVVRDAVVVCDRLTHRQRGTIQERVRELLSGLHEGLRKKAEAGVFDPYDDETDLARDRAIAVLAEIGVLYLTLFDDCPFGMPSKALQKEPRKAKTISDVVALRFADALRLTEQDSRSDQRDGGASGGGDGPALDRDGPDATTSPAAQQTEGVIARRRREEAEREKQRSEARNEA